MLRFLRRPRRMGEGLLVRSFVIACLAALIIAIGGAVILDKFQKPADMAYQTSGVRL
jgi:hypothetical protein